MQELPFLSTRWTEGFWFEKEKKCIENTIDAVYKGLCDKNNSATFHNFHVLAKAVDAPFVQQTKWGDGDCYKWIEAASYIYAKTKDSNLKKKLDYEIEMISKAQCEDGYIHTHIQANNLERFVSRHAHEDYNMGHLFTAGAVNYKMTGDVVLLNCAKKAANYLYDVFVRNEYKYNNFGWNPSHLMGLIDLYRVCNDKNYLTLSNLLLELKGEHPKDFEFLDEFTCIAATGGDQTQDGKKLREESIPVGHSVTATYLYAGAADICIEQDDKELLNALKRIYKSLNEKYIFLTGGVGPLHHGVSERDDAVHEAFGKQYYLPLSTSYNETCANIGNAMWCYKMFKLTGEAKYMDSVENVFYNSGISGTNIDCTKFRYTNPLKWFGSEQVMLSNDTLERWATHSCYCCPPQIARTLASMEKYAYTTNEDGVFINLYGSSISEFKHKNEKVKISQETKYPWNGTVKITVESNINFDLFVRIPSWCKNAKITYCNKEVSVNSGYVKVSGWKTGESINLEMDMPIRKMQSHPKVEEHRNQIALMRGPVVYCVETPDLPSNVSINSLYMDKKAVFTSSYADNLLGGVQILEGNLYVKEEQKELYKEFEQDDYSEIQVKFVPYYTWNNRGICEMSVYIPLT